MIIFDALLLGVCSVGVFFLIKLIGILHRDDDGAEFVLTDTGPVRRFDITAVDARYLSSSHFVIITLRNGQKLTSTGFNAIDLVYALNPGELEGKHFKWKKWAWTTHNLIAHPLMQVFAFMGLYKWAMKVHNRTVPKPEGFKD